MKPHWTSMIDQLFDLQAKATSHQGYQAWFTPQGQSPLVNLYQEGDQLTLTAEIPGVKKTDLTLEVKDNLLHLAGKRQRRSAGKEQLIHRERGGGDFDRWLSLPFKVNPETVSAQVQDGLLEIKLEKAASEKATSITLH